MKKTTVCDNSGPILTTAPVFALAVPDAFGKVVLELEAPLTIPAGALGVRQRFAKTYTTAIPTTGRANLTAGHIYQVSRLTAGNFLNADEITEVK